MHLAYYYYYYYMLFPVTKVTVCVRVYLIGSSGGQAGGHGSP